MRDRFQEELYKQAGLFDMGIKMLDDAVIGIKALKSTAPRLTGIEKGVQGTVNAIDPNFVKANYKGILVRKTPSHVREVDPLRYSEGLPDEGSMFNPKKWLQHSLGGMSDTVAPWRGGGSLGQRATNAVKDVGNSWKYKPGEVFKGTDGKMYQNVYERTMFGKGLAGLSSGPGVAGATYLASGSNPEKSQTGRIGSSIGQGIIWGRMGAPVAGPLILGKGLYDVTKSFIKRPKNPSTMISDPRIISKGQNNQF